jgi:hypothetical protein
MSSSENRPEAAQASATSLMQLVLEVYLAAWTRSTAVEDEQRVSPVAASSDEEGHGDADGVPDLDHFDCRPGPCRSSVHRTTGFRYVEPVGRLVTPSGRARRFDRRSERLDGRPRACASIAAGALHSTDFWNGG